MIYKHLPIFLLLVSAYCPAKGNISPVDTSEQPGIIGSSENTLRFHKPGITAIPASYSGNGGSAVHVFENIALGYASATTKSGGISSTGGGFMYHGEIGAKIYLLSQNTSKTGILSISIAGTAFSINQKYKDALGASKTNTRKYSIASIPLSYTSMRNRRGEEARGWYWQLGANLNYISKVTGDSKKVTDEYNSFYLEPFASIGLNIPVEFKMRNTGELVGHGRILVGPFISDAIMNMAKTSGVNMHGYTAGMQWALVFGG